MRSLHKVPRAQNVSTVCAFTSFAPIHIALKNGNLIGLRSSAPSSNVSQRIQLSAGQCALVFIFLWFLVSPTVISLPMFSLRTVPIFRMSTVSLLIESIVSHDIIPICCARRPADTLATFAGVETSSPLINP